MSTILSSGVHLLDRLSSGRSSASRGRCPPSASPEGDVAVWGNRATQHYAVADFDNEPREVRRITVAGDVPVSIDGTPSRVIAGDANAYSRLDELIS